MNDKEKLAIEKLRKTLSEMTIDELMTARGTYCGPKKMLLAEKKFGYQSSKFLADEIEKAIEDKEFENFHNSLSDLLNEEDDKIES